MGYMTGPENYTCMTDLAGTVHNYKIKVDITKIIK